MIRTIIPSMNRAPQLDLLLRSIKRFWLDWHDQTIIVLWRADDDSRYYRTGYGMLQHEHPQFIYVEEKEFRPDVQRLALAGEEGYLQFLVDDDVFIRPWSLSDPEFKRLADDKEVAALSLRMDSDKTYCYTENVETTVPWFRADRTWAWPGQHGDWGYPHSVDGNIWRRADVRSVLAHGAWEKLHQLEPALRAGMIRPLVTCYEKSRLLNVANNSIQDSVIANRHAGGDPVDHNRRYLAGERISVENIIAANPPSPHFEIEYEWSS